ncbi:hypothetical protein B7486_10450 [cyanobacterium TDX16]|nr:hypothetical protein B7486_10450 [cyanobacterium TDX16]
MKPSHGTADSASIACGDLGKISWANPTFDHYQTLWHRSKPRAQGASIEVGMITTLRQTDRETTRPKPRAGSAFGASNSPFFTFFTRCPNTCPPQRLRPPARACVTLCHFEFPSPKTRLPASRPVPAYKDAESGYSDRM